MQNNECSFGPLAFRRLSALLETGNVNLTAMFVLVAWYVQIVHCEKSKARAASYGHLEKELSLFTKAALERFGITKLYTHQVSWFL